MQDIVDVLERLLEQGCPCLSSSSTLEAEPSRRRLADYARRDSPDHAIHPATGYSPGRYLLALSVKMLPALMYFLTIASLR
jgi:hypothetical protein